jgi:hypothetical protein
MYSDKDFTNFDVRMKQMKQFLFGLLLVNSLLLSAQRNVKDSVISTPWIGLQYGLIAPGGDLKERFGTLNHLGVMAGYKTNRNWVLGLDGNFIFGDQIKVNSLFSHLIDSYGNITDINGEVALVLVTARGFNVNLMIGKVFSIAGPNSNSGIYVHGGLGYMQHKMRVETQDQVIPTLELTYRKGYDRYTTGLNFHQFIGYAFMANKGFVNFYGGFYCSQGLTYNRRDIFFDQPTVPVSTAQRLDLQYGIKLGWFIPIYERKPKDFYYD